MVYTVTLNPALDYVVHIPEIKMGKTNRTTDEVFYFGGKGINVSAVLNQLGIENTALGFIAGFTGEELKRKVLSAGINADFICIPQGNTRVNIKIKSAEETELNASGPLINNDCELQLLEKINSISKDDILCLSGSIPASMGKDFYGKVLMQLGEKGIRTVVDASGEALLNALKYRPWLIKPNVDELGDIFGLVPFTDKEIVSMARSLRQKGARNVLVSMGGEGALLCDENDEVYRVSAPKGVVLNSVGAGDSMVAGYIAGFLKYGDSVSALRLGISAGSATAFSASIADRGLIEQLFGTVTPNKCDF